MAKVVVKQNPEKEVPTDILAENIVAIAHGIRKLRSGRLADRALFLLIQDAAPSVGGRLGRSPITVKQIKSVFAGIDALEINYVRKQAKKEA